MKWIIFLIATSLIISRILINVINYFLMLFSYKNSYKEDALCLKRKEVINIYKANPNHLNVEYNNSNKTCCFYIIKRKENIQEKIYFNLTFTDWRWLVEKYLYLEKYLYHGYKNIIQKEHDTMTNKDSLCKVNPYLFVSGIMDYNRDNRTWTIPFTTGYGWFGFESLDANEYTAEEAINKFVDILMEEQLTGMEENKSHE